ncbi:MAG: hypothetical protein CJBNEKGG_00213 [Prosthecobacter sp.]|nr:hypothetical protein [Prosthecobacter sp.]
MNRPLSLPFLLLLVIAVPVTTPAQQAQDPMMQRMRDAMKKLAQRITDAETQMVNAQAAQLQAEASLKEMTARQEATARQLKDEVTQSKAYKDETQRRIQELEAKLQAKEKSLEQYAEALEKWRQGFEQAKTIALAKEAERIEAVSKALQQERRAAEHERKNREMYALATEILDKYESFGLGTAIMSREPFIGSMRVKFENYINDYGRKVEAAKVKPDAGGSMEPPAAPLPGEAPPVSEPAANVSKPAP